uniref:Transcription initiation factor IIF subunit alpha n=1 Tax=Chromera velia CCMP2878 TaxID=1169474 RepID=A0A0G4H200_9ALVE|eukprot:Cvel_5556.t1-p1 / transcript=Cvel_5556.t1 / gene=Cvel_5556 / organism=Chromera_velia_CCMP2878 / gene_product=hypothetical protein / transcript_product=hypothetical protein / location=Cvel_scaffold261:5591-12605(-) / protein_length=444 / sequence_SO=supercontig / SO=protein_coding / is_pseudo=false
MEGRDGAAAGRGEIETLEIQMGPLNHDTDLFVGRLPDTFPFDLDEQEFTFGRLQEEKEEEPAAATTGQGGFRRRRGNKDTAGAPFHIVSGGEKPKEVVGRRDALDTKCHFVMEEVDGKCYMYPLDYWVTFLPHTTGRMKRHVEEVDKVEKDAAKKKRMAELRKEKEKKKREKEEEKAQAAAVGKKIKETEEEEKEQEDEEDLSEEEQIRRETERTKKRKQKKNLIKAKTGKLFDNDIENSVAVKSIRQRDDDWDHVDERSDDEEDDEGGDAKKEDDDEDAEGMEEEELESGPSDDEAGIDEKEHDKGAVTDFGKDIMRIQRETMEEMELGGDDEDFIDEEEEEERREEERRMKEREEDEAVDADGLPTDRRLEKEIIRILRQHSYEMKSSELFKQLKAFFTKKPEHATDAHQKKFKTKAGKVVQDVCDVSKDRIVRLKPEKLNA